MAATLLGNLLYPFTSTIAVLTGDETLVEDYVGFVLVGLFKASPNLAQLLLQEERQGLVQLHILFLLDRIRSDLFTLQPGIVGLGGLYIQQGSNAMADRSNVSIVAFPDVSDQLVDLWGGGQVKEHSRATGKDDTFVLFRIDRLEALGAFNLFHRCGVADEFADVFV